jgi:raffinose/stachyose/melibiose transport system substrate-binding protein
METYGIIYNKSILEKYFKLSDAAVKSVDEINSFDKLKAVADGLQKHKSELGLDGAFTSAGFDSSSDWRYKTHLANLPLYYELKADGITTQPKTVKGTYLNNFKNVFDMYLTDSTTAKTQISSKTADDATSEFATGKAALYQNGTWAWTDLQKAGMKADDLSMMPIYFGVDDANEGLATGSENYWCVNKNASDADKKATEKFLEWMITNKKGQDALSTKMGFTTPFKTMNDIKSDNPLVQAAQKDATSGKTQVSWNFTLMPSEQWKNDLGSAMLEYAQGTGKWDAVKTAFVDGWKTEIANSATE